MNECTIERRVISVIAEQLGIKTTEVHAWSGIRHDLNADSLDQVEILMAIEEEFGISIPDEMFKEVKIVFDVVALVKRYVKHKMEIE